MAFVLVHNLRYCFCCWLVLTGQLLSNQWASRVQLLRLESEFHAKSLQSPPIGGPHLQYVLYYFVDILLELQTTIYKWLFQLDDSQSLHRKWLEITKHLFINGCLGFQACVNYWLNPQIWVWGYMLGLQPNLYETSVGRIFSSSASFCDGQYPTSTQLRRWERFF